MRRSAALGVAAAVLATVYVAACVLPGEPSGPQRIQFTLDSLSPYRVPLKGSVEPSIGISADGQVLTNPRYRLETLDAGVVQVDATGRRLYGIARGTDTVRVTYLGATGTPDTVFPVQVVISRVAVDSALVFSRLGVRTRLSAIAFDANNDTVPNVHFAWSSADTTVAAVNDSGMVTAEYEGATTIKVEADAVAGSTDVTVTQAAVTAVNVAPGLDTLRTLTRSMQFIAVAFDSTTRAEVPGAKARWSSSDSSVATVDATLGLATARRAGTARIIARVGQARDSATLVVKQLARFIIVTPDLYRLTAINDTGRVSAIVKDSGGSVIPNAVVTWATNDSTIATVDQTGLLRAHANGLALITATSQGASEPAAVLVRQEIAAAQTSQDSVALTGVGDTVRLSAVARDRNGFVVDSARFTWRSSNEFAATVDTTGLVTARGGGSTRIVATLDVGGRSDTVTVRVTGAPALGLLLIRTTTAGIRPDPDGYVAVVDSATHHLGTSDSVALTMVAGAHRVELTDYARNCRLLNSAYTVDVPAGGTVRVDFALGCAGPLLITTITLGGDVDPDGYTVGVDAYCDPGNPNDPGGGWDGWSGRKMSASSAACDSPSTAPIGVNGTVAFTVQEGTHTIELVDVAGNCTVADGNLRTVYAFVEDSTTLTFTVFCQETGSLRVTTATTGADLDPDGYGLSISGGDWGYSAIGVNASHTFNRLRPGNYSVQLYSMAANCSTSGPAIQTVTVVAGVTAGVAFAVTCKPFAAIHVTVATTGVDPDPDGYRVTASVPYGIVHSDTVAPNGAVVIDSLVEGTYSVALNGVARNCTVGAPGAVITVTVTPGVTTDVAFGVTCAAHAAILVRVATTGVDPDPDGYRVTASASAPHWIVRSGTVASNGAVVIDSLVEGTYRVALNGVARNCTVSAPGAVITVTVTPGVTTDVAFGVTCAAPAAILVRVATTGVDPDADGYEAAAAGPGGFGGGAVAPNGAVVVDSLNEGTYSVTLYNHSVALNCAVTSPNPATIFVATGDTAEVAFAVACTTAPQLAVVMNANGNEDIYLVNTSGAVLSRLTSDAARDFDPAWSPDGSRIAFTSTRDGNDEIYTMNADGSGQARLTINGATDRSPAWSPDGRRIAFVSYRDGNAEVYVMNADGSSPVRRTVDGAHDVEPVWRPDGSRIAFQSARDGSDEIYVMNPDGSSVTRLTFGGGRQPDWSPDGTKLVFSRTFCNWDDCWDQLIVRSMSGSEVELPAGGDPDWSRDGDWIAVNGVWAIRSDGTRQVAILGNAYQPAWKP